MPLEYAIRNCELATIKHMFSLHAKAQPLDMLKLAICKGDFNVLAEVLVNLIEN